MIEYEINDDNYESPNKDQKEGLYEPTSDNKYVKTECNKN